MQVAEAKELVIELMRRDLLGAAMAPVLDARSPDPRDPGKFTLDGKPARAIHHFSGWFAPINLGWFGGSYDMPRINGGEFYWYAFAIPRRRRYRRDHYFVCDYLQMRSWVLDFAAPLGRDHRDHTLWRADLRVFTDPPDEETTGYFRWGDEPPASTARVHRVFALDNVATLPELGLRGVSVGLFGPGGESAAHRRLKLYVANHPTDFGLSTKASAFIEHPFRTGDRVDVMFENHWPDRTVVEVEVEGEDNICTGIHQAVKYRSLAEVEGDYPLTGPNVRSLVVAYDVAYDRAQRLAERYEVDLASVDRDLVIAAAV